MASVVNSMAELPLSRRCLPIVSGLRRPNVEADILKSHGRSLGFPFQTSQVEPVLKNCCVGEHWACLEMLGTKHPYLLALEWLNTHACQGAYCNFMY